LKKLPRLLINLGINFGVQTMLKVRGRREILACPADGLNELHESCERTEAKTIEVSLRQLDIEIQQLKKKRQRLERRLKQLVVRF